MFMHFQHNGGGSSYRPSAAWKWCFFSSVYQCSSFSSPEIGAIPGMGGHSLAGSRDGFLGGLSPIGRDLPWRQTRNLARGQPPSLALMEGLMILVAGLVLITPVLTDVSVFYSCRSFVDLGTAYFESLGSFSGTKSLWKKRPPVCALCRGSEEDVIDVEDR